MNQDQRDPNETILTTISRSQFEALMERFLEDHDFEFKSDSPPAAQPSTKSYWMIEITNMDDKVVTGRVGPFDAECVADMYCDLHLIPAMPRCKFHITEMDNPELLAIACKGQPSSY